MKLKNPISGTLLCISLGGIFISPNIQGAANLTGYQIMKNQKDIQKSKTEFEEQTMMLVDAKKNKTTRIVRSWVKEVGADIHKGLLVFMAPNDIKGTALLTWQNKAKDDDQWFFESARRGQMQRISEGSKQNYFMGTDYTYEDLQSEELDDYTYNRLADANLEGQACYVVVAIPKTKTKKNETGYSQRILWINQAHFYTIRVDFYDKNTNKLWKTQLSRKYQQVSGYKWRPMENMIINYKLDHKTYVLINKRVLDVPMDDTRFTDRFILKGSHIE